MRGGRKSVAAADRRQSRVEPAGRGADQDLHPHFMIGKFVGLGAARFLPTVERLVEKIEHAGQIASRGLPAGEHQTNLKEIGRRLRFPAVARIPTFQVVERFILDRP
jgi:hypothetical protein